MRPQPARVPGIHTGRPLPDQRCPLCGILTTSPAANPHPSSRALGWGQEPMKGQPFVCGYCGYIAMFTSDDGQVVEATPSTVGTVRATTAYRDLEEKLRARHYGKPTAGPTPGNGIFERATYTKPAIDPKDLSDGKDK